MRRLPSYRLEGVEKLPHHGASLTELSSETISGYDHALW